VAAVPWWDHPGLDTVTRRGDHATSRWFADWRRLEARHVGGLVTRARRPAIAAGVLSMHPDGWVREAAVEALARSDDEAALPFLLVRASDWVGPVQAAAAGAVDELVAAGLAPDVAVRALPLVERLALPGARQNEWHAALLARIEGPLGREPLVGALRGSDRAGRRSAARLLVDRNVLDDEVLEAALAQDDAVVARRIGLAGLARRSDRDGLALALAGASDPGLRAAALHHRLGGDAPAADSAARAALVDRSALVRSLAQHHLARRGVDGAEAYRAVLPGPRGRALLGLAEVGGAADAEVVRPFFLDASPAVRAQAIGAWARLRPDGGRREVLVAFGDDAPAVVKAAGRALRRHRLDPVTVERLWRLVVAAPERPDVRRAVFTVLHGQGRWVRLVFALRALGGDPDLRRRGEALLRSTRDAWEASATAPPPELLADARRLVDERRDRLSPADRADLVDLLRPWG